MINPDALEHPDYARLAARWQRCADVLDGQDSVHRAGERYLPRLASDAGDDDAYRAYVLRAGWYGATARTLSNMLGLVFRRPPVVAAEGLDEAWLEDVTTGGLGLDAFARHALGEVLSFGRGAALLDYPRDEDGVIVTLAQAQAANRRPYWAWYDAPDITGWGFERIAGRYQLAFASLREIERLGLDGDSAGEDVVRTTWRVCRLRQMDGRPVYTQQAASTTAGADGVESQALEWTEERPVIIGGATVDSIPLVWFQAHEDDTMAAAPPLLDLVDKNLEYYRVTAQHRHGQHWTALPTPWATGLGTEEVDIITEVGPRTLWHAANADARFGMLEYNGTGLGTLKDEREALKEEMASLGARMLRGSTVAQRTATEVDADVSAQTSQLVQLATLVGARITRLLRMTARWAGAGDNAVAAIDYALNTDFIDRRMAAQELTALVAAWQSGALSDEALAWNLKQGERLPPGRSAEDEAEALADAATLADLRDNSRLDDGEDEAA